MRGNLVLDRIVDKTLRQQWHVHLSRLSKAIKGLTEARMAANNDPTGLAYLEAAMEFVDARDAERTFYWDTFVRPGTADKQFTHVETDGDTTQKIRIPTAATEETSDEDTQIEQAAPEDAQIERATADQVAAKPTPVAPAPAEQTPAEHAPVEQSSAE